METCMSESDFCEKTTLRNICNPKESEARSSSFTSSWNPMQEPQINTRDSCLSALESCQISHRCAVVYKKLKDSCQTRNDQCNFPGSGDSCLSLWMELQGTSLSNCTCSLRRRKCQGIWRGVNNNPCIRKALEALSSMGLSDIKESSDMRNKLSANVQQKSLFLDWKASSLKEFVHETGGSCLQQMTICLSDEVCNRWMVPLVEACSSSQCNSTSCQQMAQQFYAGLPYNVAQMFVLCDCEQGDQDCLHVKKGLHSGTCGEHLEEARLPICLEIFDNCLMEANCRFVLKILKRENK
ncbi:GDNF family receptor alpha-like [Esox lucius]|uniref:GDNF family receptor alpha-like n=1 Tax=Esox lucius TaxID=8010 RepID=UPI0009734369|nr:GDNF family receptor alpha-like [Esox lucius]